MKRKPTKKTQFNKKRSEPVLNTLRTSYPNYEKPREETKIPIDAVKGMLKEEIMQTLRAERWAEAAEKESEALEEVSGAKAKLARLRSIIGGSTPKKKYGILLAIQEVLVRSPDQTASDLWKYFKKEHNTVSSSWGYKTPEGDMIEVYFEEDMKGNADKLIEVWNENDRKAKAIGFKAFENYVREIKKTPK